MRTREEITKEVSGESLVFIAMVELLLDIRELLSPKQKISGESPEIDQILKAYREKIKPTAMLTDIVIKKITARLKKYSLEIILQSIENFSKNAWWMEHKGHEGMRYFFRDDDQIERFKDL